MLRISLLFVCGLACLAQTQDRPGTFMSGSASMSRNGTGYHFHYVTTVEPPPAHISDLKLHGGVTVDGTVVHRMMTDELHHQYFGYDITAVPGPGSAQYTVTIAPLTVQSTTLSPVLLPKYPPPTVMNDGDTMALDLLVSADGKQKVVDYIQVSGARTATASTTTAETRDYVPDDGAVRINSDGMVVLVNGQPFGARAGVTIKPGATIWVAAPNEGRYILSLQPREGFSKSGAIRDNVISFQSDGQQYEIRTVDPILGSKGAWNLYVMHDTQYHARPGLIQIGIDRLENMVPRK